MIKTMTKANSFSGASPFFLSPMVPEIQRSEKYVAFVTFDKMAASCRNTNSYSSYFFLIKK